MLRLPKLAFLTVLYISGALCQSLSPPTGEICPGDDVTFTCVVTTVITLWNVTSPQGNITTCFYLSTNQLPVTCAPDGRFMSSITDVNGDTMNSSLSVDSITIDLNETRVECQNGNTITVGSDDICIVGPVMDPPQFLPAIISEHDVTVNECVVTLEWNEPFISCAGSVSEYVLTVTPPPSDCQSGSGDCVLMTDQTRYNLTVTVDQMYSLTVRADTCRNMQIGEESNVTIIKLIDGTKMCTSTADYNSTGVLDTVTISWEAFSVMGSFRDSTISYTVSLTSDERTETDETERELSYTFTVLTMDIAEYRPTIQANTPCAREVMCSMEPIFSEDEIPDFEVGRNESVGTTILCNPRIPISEPWLCTAICGSSPMVNNLTVSANGSAEPNANATIQLPLLTDRMYYCVVNATTDDDTVTELRGRLMFNLSGCIVRNLLLISMDPVCQTLMSDGTCTEWMVCFENGSLCAAFDSTSVDDVAVYTTSSDYCIASGTLQRTCMADEEWSSEIPDITKVCDGGLPVWNIVLIVLGVICFIAGVVIAVILVILLLKKSCATTKLWYKMMLIASAVVTVISLGVWLGLIGYTVSNDFCEDGRQMRGANSQCEPPGGDSEVKDALVIASFVFSLLVLAVWIVSAALLKCGVDTDENTTDKAPQKPQRSKKSKEADQELAAYDSLNRGNPPSSPQPLLSESDPAYGKLNPDEEQQYSHIQREPKKPVYDPDDPNYSHFPKKEDQHYGKLDHGVKKQSTLPTSVVPPPSDSEYGKLDRSEMDSTPHYGKLDHGVRKGTTLPGTVIPPTGDEYGKLDRTQMEIVSAEPGGMYDVVTNEPRRKPPKALPKAPLGEGLYDPTAKPRKKPGH